MKSLPKKLRIETELKRENNFINHWPITSKLSPYNSLNDKHVQYHFQLPSVQKHFRRIHKIATRQQLPQISDLLKQIYRSSFILNQIEDEEIVKKEKQLKQKRQRENLRYYQRQVGNFSTIENRYPKIRNNRYRKANVNHSNDKEIFSFSEIIHKYSNTRRLPLIEATISGTLSIKPHNQSYYSKNKVIQDIILRKKNKQMNNKYV